jgi:hypothetical protein
MEIIVAITTFAANYMIRIGRENVGFRPGRWSQWTRHGGPSSANSPVAGAGRVGDIGDDGGVVINTRAAADDGWSGVAQAGDGRPNGESCAIGGERRVGDDAGSGDAAGSEVGVAPGSSAVGGGSGGGGIAGAGFGFIGGAWRQ